jgi:hypothetical protein
MITYRVVLMYYIFWNVFLVFEKLENNIRHDVIMEPAAPTTNNIAKHN